MRSPMDDSSNSRNPLTGLFQGDPETGLKADLYGLRAHYGNYPGQLWPVPLVKRDENLSGKDWLPEPEWISGWDAYELLKLQSEPYGDAASIARICSTISDQQDRKSTGLNFAISSIPPTHPLLEGFEAGSIYWFRAVYTMLSVREGEAIVGWERFVSDLHDWIAMYDCLRIRANDLIANALEHDWHVHQYDLPEAKQDPIWSFPKAMTWIATRDFLPIARMRDFRRGEGENEPVATDGVTNFNTKALGWLQCEIAFNHCECGAQSEHGFQAFKFCTCISMAWEDLVRFKGGLTLDTPELVFNLQEGWLSMTWPDGADDIRFLRRDIMDRWPARTASPMEAPTQLRSMAAAENECREWLLRQFADDPDKLRSKADFRSAALLAFTGRLTGRGFDTRVWPNSASEHGRNSAGAKKKS